MSVSSTGEIVLRQFRDPIAQSIGCDGYFEGSISVVLDATGGTASLNLQEPDDKQAIMRAIKVLSCSVTVSVGTVTGGWMRMFGKNPGTEFDRVDIVPTDNGVGTLVLGSGEPLGKAFLERDWILPLPGTRIWELQFRCTNDAAAPTITMRVFGYYFNVR